MFVTFIPRASFPVRRQPSPTLQIFSSKRYVGSYDRRSPPPVPIDAPTRDKSCPTQPAPATAGERPCVCARVAQVIGNENQRGKFFDPPPQTRQFLRADSQAAFRWPMLRQSLWRPLSVCSRKGFFYFCTFLLSVAQREAEFNQRNPQC